jgi:hypothetical protein
MRGRNLDTAERAFDVRPQAEASVQRTIGVLPAVSPKASENELRAPAPATPRSCGHSEHNGTCSTCQRLLLARWHAQLQAVSARMPAQMGARPLSVQFRFAPRWTHRRV